MNDMTIEEMNRVSVEGILGRVTSVPTMPNTGMYRVEGATEDMITVVSVLRELKRYRVKGAQEAYDAYRASNPLTDAIAWNLCY